MPDNTRRVNYYIDTELPTDGFCDFINLCKDRPNFTIITIENYAEGEEGFSDGWYNVVIDEPEITLEIAQIEIADRLGIPANLVNIENMN